MAQSEHARLHAHAADEAVQAALDALRVRGHRVTAGRRAVLQALAAHSEHLSAEQIVRAVEAGHAHRATVYRTLDLLVAAGVVSLRPTGSGAVRYHLATMAPAAAHLHGMCRVCGAVVVLPGEAMAPTVTAVRAATGFQVDAAASTLVGECAACSAGDRPVGITAQ
ncbi:Fur family transcriptional regulator [Microbacterium luticocti]|uniref:Fur family transcriptional regulator n=1 Tax=Microbacterium luticocti TaxID=451764 RepID=UPI0004253D85|nr:Fur family transcriptional regulator [Microbacterium luticocti]